jgi:hypothetical protein
MYSQDLSSPSLAEQTTWMFTQCLSGRSQKALQPLGSLCWPSSLECSYCSSSPWLSIRQDFTEQYFIRTQIFYACRFSKSPFFYFSTTSVIILHFRSSAFFYSTLRTWPFLCLAAFEADLMPLTNMIML